MSGKLICTFCDTEVEEDTSNGPKTDSRTMLAKYNTQVDIYFYDKKRAEITWRQLTLDCTTLWASQEFRKCRIYTNNDWSRTELCWGLFQIHLISYLSPMSHRWGRLISKLKKALHENKDDDGFGPTIKKAAKNPDGTEKDKWRTTGGAAFEDNIQVFYLNGFRLRCYGLIPGHPWTDEPLKLWELIDLTLKFPIEFQFVFRPWIRVKFNTQSFIKTPTW